MTLWTGYFVLETRSLTDAQIEALLEGVVDIAPGQGWSPYPIRPDGEARIYEAAFNADDLTPEAMRGRVARVYNVPVSSIHMRAERDGWTSYSYNGERLRFKVFGGVEDTWRASNAAARAYLAERQAAWNTPRIDVLHTPARSQHRYQARANLSATLKLNAPARGAAGIRFRQRGQSCWQASLESGSLLLRRFEAGRVRESIVLARQVVGASALRVRAKGARIDVDTLHGQVWIVRGSVIRTELRFQAGLMPFGSSGELKVTNLTA